LDENVGRAAIYVPPDTGLPPEGILAQGTLNEAGWVLATLDLGLLRAVRREGQVRCFADRAHPEAALQKPLALFQAFSSPHGARFS
jgi:predicted amidohydrolase